MTVRLFTLLFLGSLLLVQAGCGIEKFFFPARGAIQVQGRWPSQTGFLKQSGSDTIASLTVSVSGEGLAQPITQQITRNNTTEMAFTVMFESVPMGNKRVEAAAYTDTQKLVAKGSTEVTVKAGEIVEASILLTLGEAPAELSTITVYVVSTLPGSGAKVAVDGSGNVYVAGGGSQQVYKITPDGVLNTLAGSGTAGYMEGTGTAAQFNDPLGIGVDNSGNVYVAENSNHAIRKITPEGEVTTFAGGQNGFLDANGPSAKFNWPWDATVDSSGNVYVADHCNQRIRKISPLGDVSTLAGSGPTGCSNGGFANGPGTTTARFNAPLGVAVDSSGNVYVADRDNHRIRKVTPLGEVTTFAGSGTAGFADGTGTGAQFNQPWGVGVDGNGNVFVADAENDRIRKITPAGVVTTLAGSTAGYADGTGTAAQFDLPTGVAVDGNGNIFVADRGNTRIRKLTPQTVSATPSPIPVVTTLAGSGSIGFGDGTGTAAHFQYPTDVAVDSGGNVYVADVLNQRIRKIDPSGVVITLAGNGTAGFADDTGTTAQFYTPSGVAVDGSGNVYVADQSNHRIRKIDISGAVTTIAGNGTAGYVDDTGTTAQFNRPIGVAVDSSGNVYVADYYNHRIRKIDILGAVTTIAGSGTAGFTDETGTTAQFDSPRDVAVDSSGNVYVADYYNHRIRKIDIFGIVTTLAGGTPGFADGSGTSAQFNSPSGVAVDSNGNVYVGDALNSRIRQITPAGVVTTVSGSNSQGYADGTGTAAMFNIPEGVAVDGSGNIYVADEKNHRIRKIQQQ